MVLQLGTANGVLALQAASKVLMVRKKLCMHWQMFA